MALYEKDTLDWERVKESIEIGGAFNKYMKEIHGHSEEEWSRDNKVR